MSQHCLVSQRLVPEAWGFLQFVFYEQQEKPILTCHVAAWRIPAQACLRISACPLFGWRLEWESSAAVQTDAEQDFEANRAATDLGGLEGPVAQSLGDGNIHSRIWTLLHRKLLQLPRRGQNS